METWVLTRPLLGLCWCAWLYPFVFRAPHAQRRKSVTAVTPTRVGLLLECAGIAVAYVRQRPGPPPLLLILAAAVLFGISTWMAWRSVEHLGRQFRITAGLWEDHELVRTGPYGLVRHPIYASLLGMLVVTFLLVTPWRMVPISLAVYIAGTEIRVRAEDALLFSRFHEEFRAYQRLVSAYIPFIR